MNPTGTQDQGERDVGRCDTCVLPRTSRLIRFEGTTCSICAGSRSRDATEMEPEHLDRFVDRIKEAGRGRPFDCVVGLSGGRDSTYLLHQLVRRHGLRCLAGYYRTPYTPDTIDANVSIGMVLRNGSGVVLSDTATTRLMQETVTLEAGRRCEVAFEFSIRFCPGSYGLSVNVEDPLLQRYYTYAWNVASFAVTDGEGCGGLCYIEPAITVRHEQSGESVSRVPDHSDMAACLQQ